MLLLIAQVGAFVWLVYKDWDHEHIQKDQGYKIAALETALDRATAAIEHQSSVLDRTIGKVVPSRMPDDWSRRLTELERVARDEGQWPHSGQAAQQYLDSVSELISELPSWAEREYMPRLNVIRWSAMVFTTINPPGKAPQDVHAQAEILAALSESAPDGASAKMIERVDREQQNFVRAADEADWQRLRQRAAGIVADPKTATSGFVQQDIALLLAYSESADPTRRTEAEKLVKSLRKIALRLDAEQQVQSLRTRIEALMQLKDKDPSLFEAGVRKLLGEVRSTRMNLALSGLDNESLDTIDSQLIAQIEQRQLATLDDQEIARARAVRAYQQYALESIAHFNKRFKNREKIVQEALKQIREGNHDAGDYTDLPSVQHAIKNAEYRETTGYLWNGEEYKLEGMKEGLESHLTHRVCRDAMVSHLLPINQRLLETPVQDLFQQAWQKGWDNLGGRTEQTYVAEQTADVKKMTLNVIQGGSQ